MISCLDWVGRGWSARAFITEVRAEAIDRGVLQCVHCGSTKSTWWVRPMNTLLTITCSTHRDLVCSPVCPGWISYCAIESFGSICVSLFWAYVNSSMNVDTAKSAFGLIFAGGNLGSVMGRTLAVTKVKRGQVGFCGAGVAVSVLSRECLERFGSFERLLPRFVRCRWRHAWLLRANVFRMEDTILSYFVRSPPPCLVGGTSVTPASWMQL